MKNFFLFCWYCQYVSWNFSHDLIQPENNENIFKIKDPLDQKLKRISRKKSIKKLKKRRKQSFINIKFNKKSWITINIHRKKLNITFNIKDIFYNALFKIKLFFINLYKNNNKFIWILLGIFFSFMIIIGPVFQPISVYYTLLSNK